MLGLNVSPGDTVKNKYYPKDDSTVNIGTEQGTVLKTFSEALSAGIISKVSDDPDGMYTLTGGGDATDWIYFQRFFTFGLNLDGGTATITLEWSPDEGNTVFK